MTCPVCDYSMTCGGQIRVTDKEGNWDEEVAERWDCKNGHTILIIETPRKD